MTDSAEKDISESIAHLQAMSLPGGVREQAIQALRELAAAAAPNDVDALIKGLLVALQATQEAPTEKIRAALIEANETKDPAVERLYHLLEALIRHFDVLAGEARDTQWFRQRLTELHSDAKIQPIFDELEKRLLDTDDVIAREREREEKTLGYLQRQCEDLTLTARQVAEDLQQDIVSLANLSDELSVEIEADHPRVRRLARQCESVGESRAELGRVADRLTVIERKINELRSGVRNRSDLAFKDDWTGLYRDDGFKLRATELFARWERAGSPLSAVEVSVDVAEDRPLTPLARNELMRQVAADLERRVRVSDVIGLTDVDRFTLLLPDTNLEGCHAFASRMVVALETAGFNQLGHQLRVVVISGITSAVDGDSLETLLSRAKQARDAAQAKGACCEALV
jgi:GGDEF domain-containing protein